MDVTRDGFLGQRLTILQPAGGGHRAGLDALLLAASLPDDTEGSVLDLGAGVGVAGLAAAARLGAVHVTLAEIDPATADLARRNVAENGPTIGDRVRVVEADVLAAPAERAARGLPPNAFDHVILNPPFHPAGRTRPSPDPARAGAHSLDEGGLDRWMRAAAGLVHPSGTVSVIFRADELQSLLAAVARRFGSLSVLPFHPAEGAPATRIVLRGRPQGRAPLRLLPGIVLHAPGGAFRPAVAAALDGAALPVTWW